MTGAASNHDSNTADDDIVGRLLRGELTEEQAKEFARRDSECIAFTLLAVQRRLAPGGLMQMWHRLSDILFAWYEEIHQQILDSGRLHADETGWRVSGKTHWLWCFGNDDSVFYMIDRSRGSPAIKKFFTRAFEGVLVTDFWSPYDGVCCAEKQKCWPHLLRDAASDHSDRGAYTQSVLMSVLRTLRLRGHNPIDVLLEALERYSKTGKLPALPDTTNSRS